MIKKEKAFQKYQSFVSKILIMIINILLYFFKFQYFTMKALKKKRKEKSLIMKDKLAEKQEKLIQLEKQHDKE